MHSLCSGHSAPVISGVSVASNPPRRKTNGNQGSSPLAALPPPASYPQRGLRPMATCADCAHAFDRSPDGRCALAASADVWRGVIPALRASPLARSAYHRRTMTSGKPFMWHCHTCGCGVGKPLFGPSGQAGVYWPYCADCFAKLSDDDQKAVANERAKPLPFNTRPAN
jgi:hypothetical protein